MTLIDYVVVAVATVTAGTWLGARLQRARDAVHGVAVPSHGQVMAVTAVHLLLTIAAAILLVREALDFSYETVFWRGGVPLICVVVLGRHTIRCWNLRGRVQVGTRFPDQT